MKFKRHMWTFHMNSNNRIILSIIQCIKYKPIWWLVWKRATFLVYITNTLLKWLVRGIEIIWLPYKLLRGGDDLTMSGCFMICSPLIQLKKRVEWSVWKNMQWCWWCEQLVRVYSKYMLGGKNTLGIFSADVMGKFTLITIP